MNAKPASPNLKESSPAILQEVSPRKILLADDNDGLLVLSTRILSHAGYKVHAVRDGSAAWEALSISPYDLLVTDHDMPGLTGFELIKKMHAARMHLPVIMVTGSIPQVEFDLCPHIKPAATLLKPFTGSQLSELVANVLQVSAAERLNGTAALLEMPCPADAGAGSAHFFESKSRD